jgi:hypothetical protein
MADSQLARLIGERRKRLVATILGHAEREFFTQLTPQQQRDFRAKTLTAIDDYADLMRDVLKISGDGVVLNSHALELLEALHDNQKAIARKLEV